MITVVIVAVYLGLSPDGSPLLCCPFKFFTGLDCPGCGSQRACQALMRGDIASAWGYNPAVLIGLPLALFFGIVDLWKEKWPRLHKATCASWIIWSAFWAIIAWWVGRNIF